MKYETSRTQASVTIVAPPEVRHCTIAATTTVNVEDMGHLTDIATALELQLGTIAQSANSEVQLHCATQPALGPQKDYDLSHWETEIAALVAQGLTSKQIGNKLQLAEATIKDYTSKCQQKMNALNRANIAALYVVSLVRSRGLQGLVEEGFIPPSE